MKKIMMLVLSLSLVLSAAFVPMDRAKKVAVNQYNHYCADASAKSAEVIKVVENKFEGETTWYAFEFSQGGFVIVSAEDTVYPVLGYSSDGEVFDMSKKGGENFKAWFGNYDKEIAYMRKNSMVDENGQKRWKDIEANNFSSSKAAIVVDALLRSKWDQSYPWADDCPEGTPVGCVATAMAQITRYHQWPDIGVGSNTYTENGRTHTVNFASQGFNYSLMPLEVELEYGLYPEYWEECSATQAEIDELARHSYWMGVSVNMSYDAAGSGAYSTDADNAFIDHWKGTSTYATFTKPTLGSTDGSYATIKAQLDNGRPWYWSGNDGTMGGVGHAFVLDGYRDDYYYHFNWGWGGGYNGWFHRGSLSPDGTGIGGGTGDYSSNQAGVTYIPNGQATFNPVTLNGSVSGYTINLSWTAQANATGYMIFKRFNDNQTADLEYLGTATGTTYQLTEQIPGIYYFVAKVVYPAGESKYSNIRELTIVNNPADNGPLGLTPKAIGRTAIDVKWIAAYAGRLDWFENFNASLKMPPGWRAMASGQSAAGWITDGMAERYMQITDAGIAKRNKWVETDAIYALNLGNFFLLSSGFPDGNPTYTQTGDAQNMEGWLLSPLTAIDANSTVKYTGRFRCVNNDGTLMGAPSEGWPVYDVVTYSGDFSETGTTKIAHTVCGTRTQNSLAENNQFTKYENMSLATAAGQTARVGFKIRKTTYSWCIDDIQIGTSTGAPAAPTAYKVYRNGVLAHTTSNGTTYNWSDTGFADGNNTYYAYAVRSGVDSRKSNTETAYMNANPKPGYLAGTVSNSPANDTANLSWFAPYHYAPQWFYYIAPEDCFSATTMLDENGDGTPDLGLQKRRVVFKAQDMGYTYPVTIDSLAAGFYEFSDDLWGSGNNDFVFKIFTEIGDSVGYDSLVVHTSPTQYAVHNQITKYKLATPVVLDRDFNIEVQTLATTGAPWGLMGSAGGADTHSYFHYSNGSYYYGITFGGGEDWAEWNHMAYITSSAPAPIAKDGEAKSGWVTASGKADPRAIGIELKNPKTVVNKVKGPKALSYYKIYRDGSYQGQTTSLSWSQAGVPAGDHNYAVTAYYSSPTGESTYSVESGTEITLGFGSAPSISAPTSISPTTAPETTTPASFNMTNSGEQGSDYSMSHTYVGYQTPGGTWHSNNFQSGLVYTNSGAYNWATATGGTWNGSTTCAAAAVGGSYQSIMTSAAFNTSTAGATLYLDFDYNYVNRGSSSGIVEYYTGSAWTQVWSVSGANASGHVQVALPIKSANTQVRFTANMIRSTGQNSQFQVDNITVSSAAVPYTWLTFIDPTSGRISGNTSDTIDLSCNATGLVAGTYVANIAIATQDPVTPNKTVQVNFVVATNPPPAVPSLVSPTDASSTTDLTPTFDWADVSGATSYTIQVDNNSDFSSPEITNSPTASTYTPASNLAAGTYYWRVLATNANGSSDYSGSWSVILNATVVPGVPTNIVTSVVSGNIFINWDDAANATNYDVYASANPYAGWTFLANVTNSEYTYVPGTNTKMFFQIVSKNATKTLPKKIEIAEPVQVSR
jgi:hypothetical protein